MRIIDTDALRDVAAVLGSGAPIDATLPVEFDDENLQQAFDISKAIRRGRTLPPSEGLYSFRITNSHPGAGNVETLVNPRSPGQAIEGNGYPALVPETLDPWLISLGLEVEAANVANFSGAQAFMGYIDSQMGFGPAAARVDVPLQFWNQAAVFFTGHDALGFNGTAGTDSTPGTPINLPMRFPNRSRIVFDSGAVTGAVDISLVGIVGLFARGLGQDGLGSG